MSKLLHKLMKRPLRLDRAIEVHGDLLPVFDLDLLERSFKESLLVARLTRRPSKYLRGRSGASR
ncbi:MAG TPA: hypothetical protein VE981_16405 [Planctomycetota bacterium]|nr:hypothetical protein [Planctomycetota bacterium]